MAILCLGCNHVDLQMDEILKCPKCGNINQDFFVRFDKNDTHREVILGVETEGDK